MSPVELAENFDLSEDTLADWRSQRKGPPYLKVGKNIWYLKEHIDTWAESQLIGEDNGITSKMRNVALQVQVQRKGIRGNDRFGRHRRKQDGGSTV